LKPYSRALALNLFDLKQNIQAQAKKNLYENNLVISNFEEVIKKIVI